MNLVQLNVLYIAALANFGLGIFLIVDSLFLHTLSLNYSGLGLTGTPYFHHSFWGLFFSAMGVFLFWIAKANDRRMG